jgi:BASS family bile acid:Na+ symporter
LAANFIFVPLLGYAIARVLDLDEAHAIGLFLMATAAGAAFFVALVRIARLDLSVATGLLVALLVVTIVYMPLVIPLVLPWADVRLVDISAPLLLTMLLPLFLGLTVHGVAPRLAATLLPFFRRAAQVSFIVLIVATFVLHLPSILEMVGSGALAAAFLLTLGAFAVGYSLGGNDADQRALLGLGTGQRNVAAAMVVATQAFEAPGPLVMVVVSSLVAFTVLLPAAFLFRRRSRRGTLDRFDSNREEAVGGASSRAPT